MNYPSYVTSSTNTSTIASSAVYVIIAFILGIIGAILVYFLFLDPKKEDNYNGFTKKLYDFLSFKTMTLEFFIKIIYLFSAIFITIFSLSLIGQNFLLFLLVLIFGNIIARLIAESSILFLMMYKRVNEIKESVKPNKTTEKEKDKDKEKSKEK
jgi:hypothetical protein